MKQGFSVHANHSIRERLIKTRSTMSMQNFMADPNFASKMVNSGIFLSYHETQNYKCGLDP